ncbi:unnamed protein product, partial [Tetraodon nigroviridis]
VAAQTQLQHAPISQGPDLGELRIQVRTKQPPWAWPTPPGERGKPSCPPLLPLPVLQAALLLLVSLDAACPDAILTASPWLRSWWTCDLGSLISAFICPLLSLVLRGSYFRGSLAGFRVPCICLACVCLLRVGHLRPGGPVRFGFCTEAFLLLLAPPSPPPRSPSVQT